MTRKILAVTALALVLIGIAYVKALYSHQDRNEKLSPEAAEVLSAELLDDYLKKEEAARAYDSLKSFYSDSLQKLTLALSSVENMPKVDVDSLQKKIELLRGKLNLAENNVKKAKRGKTAQFEKLVATFYKGELSQLPSDLSKYERDVSIKEIEDKAKKYFGVSSKTLSKIIKNNK